MRILGIDPSIANFGIALVSFSPEAGAPWFSLEHGECVVTKPIKGEPRGLGLMRRTSEICDRLVRIAQSYTIDAVAVEAMAFVRGKQRLETAAMSGRARGIVDMTAAFWRIRVYEIQAKTAKKALTDDPGASKEAMISGAVARLRLGVVAITMAKSSHQEHIADAVGMAVAAALAIDSFPAERPNCRRAP